MYSQTASGHVSIDVIQHRLSHRLSVYMCPSALYSLNSAPKSLTGKTDRALISKLTLSPSDRFFGEHDQEKNSRPLTETQERLKDLWQDLTAPQHGTNAQTDFLHTGGSSLLLLKLQKRVEETFGCEVPLIRMFESSTIGDMASQIEHRLKHEKMVKPVDWMDETQLPLGLQDLYPVSSTDRPSPPTLIMEEKKEPINVVLTGSTGRLGRALLTAMIAEPLISRVHCVGVRNAQRRQPGITGTGESKVTLYDGDLVRPNLGLSQKQVKSIFEDVGLVNYNGADMSYLKSYASLRTANLQSTKDLVKLVAKYGDQRRVPFHYVSTISVGNIAANAAKEPAQTTGIVGPSNGADVKSTGEGECKSGDDDGVNEDFTFTPVSVAQCPPSTTVSPYNINKIAHGYVATKWASEVFLENVSQRHNNASPIIIHRPSLMTDDHDDHDETKETFAPSKEQQKPSGRSRDRVGSPGFDFFQDLRWYSSLMHAVPTISASAAKKAAVNGTLDVVPLKDVVGGIMGSVAASLRWNPDSSSTENIKAESVKYIHHLGGVNLDLDDLSSFVSKWRKKGDNDEENEKEAWEASAERLSMTEWTRRAGGLGMHPTMVALCNSVALADGRLILPRTTTTTTTTITRSPH